VFWKRNFLFTTPGRWLGGSQVKRPERWSPSGAAQDLSKVSQPTNTALSRMTFSRLGNKTKRRRGRGRSPYSEPGGGGRTKGARTKKRSPSFQAEAFRERK